MRVSKAAALIAAMGIAGLSSGTAWAQNAMAQPVQAPAQLSLTANERTALLPLKQAVDARNWAMAAAALPAARAAARSQDARYVVARLEYDIAAGTQNRAALTQAISGIITSGKAPVAEQVEVLQQYAGISYDAGNLNTAEATLNRALQLAPGDAETLAMLGQLSRNRGNNPQALSFFQRASRAAEASGRRLPESQYELALALAEQGQQRPLATEFARQLVTYYPSPSNWRDALVSYRAMGQVDPALNLEALRLMRAAGALAGERDYMQLADALDKAELSAEAKAVLDEAVARGAVVTTDAEAKALLARSNTRIGRERTGLAARVTQARGASATASQARTAADTLAAHGRYAEAAELYRLALTRTGEDPNLVNLRLGSALAMAGQRAEAEAALRAVSPGTQGDLAALWLIWLAQRPAA